MILSSADILRILGGSEIIRLSATIKIVDGKPPLSGAEGITIYVGRFPELGEFEATFTLWIESDGDAPDDVVLAELKRLLPKVEISGGLMTQVTTTEFRSESTQRAPEAPKPQAAQVDLSAFEGRFQALVEDVQDQMLLVTSGRPGKDGQDGRDGLDGRDGRDMVATDASLEDLNNVESNIAKENGQVLTWKDGVWQNLFIPQVVSSISATGGTTTTSSGQQTSLIGRGEWRYSTSTAGDPASGRVQFNDADPSLATEIYVSRYNSDGKDVYNLLTALVTSGTLFYTQGGDADNYYLYDVTANAVQVGGTHILISVALRNEGVDAGFSNNQTIGLASYTNSSGGGGGATQLNDLTDVTIDPALLDRDMGLVYDGAQWVVSSPPVLVEGHNQTGVTIPKGTPVYVAGTHSSGKPLLQLADADGAATFPAIGLTHEDILDGVDGHVMLSGILKQVDTSSFLAGNALYLSTTPGALTSVRPTAATEKVQKVGLVTRVHATAGSILIIGAGRTNDINNELVALIGAGDRDAVDLGTFTGSTISDNVDVRTALQELETAHEAAAALAASALQPGDNITSLVNDAGYVDAAGASAAAPVQSVASKTGDVTLVKADITDFFDADYATAAQGALADSAVQPGDNVDVLGGVTVTTPVAGEYLRYDGIGEFRNSGIGASDLPDLSATYATAAQGALADSATQPGDNVSTLTNDAGYITNAGVTQIVAGTNVTIDPVGGTGAVTINASGGGGGGVTSIIAGSGISVDQATGDVTITATGGGGSVWSTNGTTAYYNTGAVSIGTDSPGAADALHIRNNPATFDYPVARFSTSASVLGLGDVLGQISFCDSSNATAAAIRVYNAETGTWGPTDRPTQMEFYTTPFGSATPARNLAVRADGAFVVGPDTGVRFAVTSNSEINVGGSIGTAGQVLTSNGVGAAATWETPSTGGSSLWTNTAGVATRTGGVAIGGTDLGSGSQLNVTDGGGFNPGTLQLTSNTDSPFFFSTLGRVAFGGNTYDTPSCTIDARYDGFATWDANGKPLDIVFGTSDAGEIGLVRDRLTITHNGRVILQYGDLPVYANPAAATSAGETQGTICRDSSGYLFVAQ